MKRTRRISLMVVVGVMLAQSLVTILSTTDASANGRAFNSGYFFNKSASGLSHFNVLEGGLPRSAMETNKQAFLDYVNGTLIRSSPSGPCPGNGCDYVGAAYIIQTMRGGAKGWDHGYPNAAAVADWAQKVRNPNIGLRWGSEGGWAGGVTTARFRSGERDVARVGGITSGQTLTFYNISTGEIYYMLREACANPLGGFPGLPEQEEAWSVTPTASADRTTVRPGQTITWTHTVKNDGPASTRSVVNYRYQNSNGLGTGAGSDNSLPSGTVSGGSKSFTSTYAVQASDADKVLCRSTSSSPWSSSDAGRTTSAAVCVTVVNQWTITPTSTVTSITGTTSTTVAKPGDTITWKHVATNNGPDATRKDVIYRYENGTGLPAGSGPAQTLPVNTVNGGSKSVTSTYQAVVSDLGKTICRATSVTPQSWSNASKLTSAAACIAVPYNYTLTPFVTLDRSGTIEAPSSVQATPSVTNSGPTNSRLTKWQVSRVDVASRGDLKNAAGTGSTPSEAAPCAYFGGAKVTCKSVGSGKGDGSGESTFDKSGKVITGDLLNTIKEEIKSLPVGSQVCFAMSVSPASSTSLSNWAHSALVCLTVGKKPKVQVLGGDLIVGRLTPYNAAATSNVITSTSSWDTGGKMTYYGSWAEYAIVPSGKVTGMASGAGYAGGDSSSDGCSKSVLTFVNRVGAPGSCDASQLGKYVNSTPVPKLASRFPTTHEITGASIDLKDASLFGISHSVKSNLNITNPSKAAIAQGRWIVINDADATVTIKDDITYASTASLKNPNDIPQVVIIAKNIIIDDSVKNVDAWLIAVGSGVANGYINTCASVAAGAPSDATVNSEKCASPLRVNGPVFANKLYLNRTAGAGVGAQSGNPAEVFNLRADAYVWASAQGSTSSRVPTMSTKELPPRF